MGELMILTGYMIVLAIGGFVADYIFPHIEPLNDFIDSLPIMHDFVEANDDILRKEKAA